MQFVVYNNNYIIKSTTKSINFTNLKMHTLNVVSCHLGNVSPQLFEKQLESLEISPLFPKTEVANDVHDWK